jgi:hypothetical protein
LELLRETLPGRSRVAYLWSRPGALAAVEEAARALGVLLQSLEIHEPDQLDAAFEAAVIEQADALSVATSIGNGAAIPGGGAG